MFDSAAEFARETNYDVSTIIDYIQKGTIRAYRKKFKQHYKIPENQVKKIKLLQKPYQKFSKNYSDAEIRIIMNNKDLPNKVIAKMIGRTETSVRVKRCRMRKEGYDV